MQEYQIPLTIKLFLLVDYVSQNLEVQDSWESYSATGPEMQWSSHCAATPGDS